MTGDRAVAVPLKTVQHGPLGGDVDSGGRVVEGMQQLADGRVVQAALQADDPGPHGRAQELGVEGLGGPVLQADAGQARAGQHQGVELAVVEAGQPRVDVAPAALDRQIRPLAGVPRPAAAPAVRMAGPPAR